MHEPFFFNISPNASQLRLHATPRSLGPSDSEALGISDTSEDSKTAVVGGLAQWILMKGF